jgi:hypothetical protein
MIFRAVVQMCGSTWSITSECGIALWHEKPQRMGIAIQVDGKSLLYFVIELVTSHY